VVSNPALHVAGITIRPNNVIEFNTSHNSDLIIFSALLALPCFKIAYRILNPKETWLFIATALSKGNHRRKGCVASNELHDH
jgi:hypothetical protein